MKKYKEMGSSEKYGPCEVCKKDASTIYRLSLDKGRDVFGCSRCLDIIQNAPTEPAPTITGMEKQGCLGGRDVFAGSTQIENYQKAIESYRDACSLKNEIIERSMEQIKTLTDTIGTLLALLDVFGAEPAYKPNMSKQYYLEQDADSYHRIRKMAAEASDRFDKSLERESHVQS